MNVAQLIAAGIGPTMARTFFEPLNLACLRFDITSPVRQAAFIAEASVESAGFTRLEENLFYTTPERVRAVFQGRVSSLGQAATLIRNPKALALIVYSGRLGNGPSITGDGWKFRGRGIFQLTGRDNYEAAESVIGHPYSVTPDLVAQPVHACLTAAWFWASRGLNGYADNSDLRSITRAINGPAMLAEAERENAFRQAMAAFA